MSHSVRLHTLCFITAALAVGCGPKGAPAVGGNAAAPGPVEAAAGDVTLQTDPDDPNAPGRPDFADYPTDEEAENAVSLADEPEEEESGTPAGPSGSSPRREGFSPPSIVATGETLDVRGRTRDRTVHVACDSGDVHFYRGNIRRPSVRGQCKSEGLHMSVALYNKALPALHACVATNLKQKPQLGTWPAGAPLEIVYDGVFANRNVRGGRARSRSLHAYGRAIDIFAMRIGTLKFDYQAALRRGRSSVELNHFWYKLRECMRNADSTFTVLDARYNSLHRDHIHVSVRFPQRIAGVASGAPAGR